MREQADRAITDWVRTGKFRYRLKAFILDAIEPTPAAGFVFGGLSTALMLWFAAPLLVERPLLAALLIGCEIAGLAWIWQGLYDRYWR